MTDPMPYAPPGTSGWAVVAVLAVMALIGLGGWLTAWLRTQWHDAHHAAYARHGQRCPKCTTTTEVHGDGWGSMV